MKTLLTISLILACFTANASVKCQGTISSVYKWNDFETLSILLKLNNGEITRWISMPTKSDESMALLAFASQKRVDIYMAEDSITSCVDGWSHNTELLGYFVVSND